MLMRALRDFNIPKIVTDDVPIFMGLIGDLFPALDVPRKRDIDFEKMVKQAAIDLQLQPEDNFILKVALCFYYRIMSHFLFIYFLCFYVISPLNTSNLMQKMTLNTHTNSGHQKSLRCCCICAHAYECVALCGHGMDIVVLEL